MACDKGRPCFHQHVTRAFFYQVFQRYFDGFVNNGIKSALGCSSKIVLRHAPPAVDDGEPAGACPDNQAHSAR